MWLTYELFFTGCCRCKKFTIGAHTSSQKRSSLRIIQISRNHTKLKKHFDCEQLGAERSFGVSTIYVTSVLTVFPKNLFLWLIPEGDYCAWSTISLNWLWPFLFLSLVLIEKHNNLCRLTCWKESSNKVCLDTLIFTWLGSALDCNHKAIMLKGSISKCKFQPFQEVNN